MNWNKAKIQLINGQFVDAQAPVIISASRSHNETWMPVVKSKHAQITDNYNELTLFLQEQKGKRRKIDLIFRVYDDGLAFRYKLYRSEFLGNRQMTAEQSGFNNVTAENFKPQVPTLVANTRAAELAKFVVYESPYMVVCEHPKFVLGQPGADFLKIVPSVWDNMKFLGGTPGEYVAIAKQSGKNWFIGVLNNSKEKEITLNTDFLPAGKHKVEIWSDAKDSGINPKNLKKTELQLEAGKPLKIKLAKAGGCVAVIAFKSELYSGKVTL